jgi:NADPH:quinone reductase-like Zn-dependent oxidoreductase
MKAIVQEGYGALSCQEVPRPAAGDGEVLVRVRAASVNAYDWHALRGDPYLARLAMPSVFGFRGVRRPVRGRDLAGEVVTGGGDFRPGDEVFGDTWHAGGAFAEYAVVPVTQVAHKPAEWTFEQAAAVPLAGNTALMGLAEVRAGQRVLVNGASGGVGTFAVQLAKASGAEVTGVCSGANAELVAKLGADHVVDYTQRDISRSGEQFDVVLDLVGNFPVRGLLRLLTPEGVAVLSGGGASTGGSLVGPMGLLIRSQLVAPFVRPRRLWRLEERPSTENLQRLAELASSGAFTPAIDRTYPLAETPAALHYLEKTHASAKVVITV